MNPKRLSVKFFVSPDPEAAVDLEPFIGLFHRVIQKGSVPGLLLDVADYMHVPNGPGVLLVGHDVDYGIDSTGGRTGLLTVRKRAGEAPQAELLRDTLRKALLCVKAIDADGAAKIAFDLSSVKIDWLDRLVAANTGAAFEAVEAEVLPVLRELYDDPGLDVERAGEDDTRRALSLRAATSTAVDADVLLERIGGETAASSRDEPAPPVEPGQSPWDISVEQLKRLRDEGADFVLVDVREMNEIEICEIGGLVMPMSEFGERMEELDRDAHIVVHCHVGGRSAHAVTALRNAGYANSWSLQGGIRAWIQRIDPSLTDY